MVRFCLVTFQSEGIELESLVAQRLQPRLRCAHVGQAHEACARARLQRRCVRWAIVSADIGCCVQAPRDLLLLLGYRPQLRLGNALYARRKCLLLGGEHFPQRGKARANAAHSALLLRFDLLA